MYGRFSVGYIKQARMRLQNICNSLNSCDLQPIMSLCEAMQKKGNVLVGEILQTISNRQSFIGNTIILYPEDSTSPNKGDPSHVLAPLDSSPLERLGY